MAPGLKRSLGAAAGRRLLALGLVLAVALLHGWVAGRVADAMLGWGEAEPEIARMEVAFVRELKPSAPPGVAPRRVVKRVRAARAAAASAPAERRSVETTPAAEPAPQPAVALAPPPQAPASAAQTLAETVAAVEPAASAQPAPAASAPAAANVAFEWPPSSRLSYLLTGNVNGPVQGSARVQWIRSGTRYQVHLDTRVALVVSRRMTSEGELTTQGLRPRRYEEVTEMLLGTPRRRLMQFEDERIVLADGRQVPRPEGVQDPASQLVQLVWLFTMHPEQLVPGGRVQLPLALGGRVDEWVFDVLEPETVDTPFGEVPTLHVKPRRPARPGKVLTVECWFAPTLQYLPARIRVEQDEQTYLDLVLQAPPLQAAPGL